MAKIVYGVAGEGFGHSSRAHLIGQKLIDAGHDVMFVASERSFAYLQQYFAGKIMEITGLSLVYKNREMEVLKTFITNIAKLPRIAKNFKLFKSHLAPFKPDLVITDFEPFTALWAKRNKIPLLSIDHEHILTRCKHESLKNDRFARFNAILVTKCYRIKADYHIVLNFFEIPVKSKSTILAPPIIRPIVSQFKPTSGQHIVYYSTDNSGLDKLLNVFRGFPDYKFYIYGFNQSAQYDNCILKETSTQGFLADLAGCRAMIATAGFSLLSECMYFKKKMFLLPIRGQYEQLLNAHYVRKLNLGFSSYNFDEKVLGNFLEILDEPMKPKEQVIWPDNEKFFEVFRVVLNRLGLSINI